MQLKFENYRFAKEVLESKNYQQTYDEMIEVLKESSIPTLDSPKIRERGKKAEVFRTDQKKLNEHYKKEFRRKGWEISPRITEDEVTKIEADFKKGRVQMEVQFGNMARWYTDVFKFQVSYSLGLIDVGVEAVPIQKFAKTINENVAHFERIKRELPYAKMSITLPILVIGLEPEKEWFEENEQKCMEIIQEKTANFR